MEYLSFGCLPNVNHFQNDQNVFFWVPTYQYFIEFPMRIQNANALAYAGQATVNGKNCEGVLASWNTTAPQRDIDQYLIWLDSDPKQKLFECIGKTFECTINIANAWTPRLSVVNEFGRDRVWLAGDAVRLVTPAGGYGMNTGVGDALALGWVLAAVIKGWGTPKLFQTYEAERRPVALRNRAASGDYVLIRLKIAAAMRDAIYDDSKKGEKVRKKIGDRISMVRERIKP